MKRVVLLFAVSCLLFALPALVGAQQAKQSPRLSSDDLPPPGTERAPIKDAETRAITGDNGSPVHNPLGILRASLSKMTTITSLRTHLEVSTSEGTREVVAEMIKPDRVRIISPDVEIVAIGRTYYMRKPGEEWQVTKSKADLSLSASAFDYAQFVNKMLSTSGITITGRILGDEVVDGYTTVVYEFTVVEGSQKGRIETCVGKDDGYLRKLFMFAPSLTLKAWFTGINESFTIEQPQI